MLALFTGLLGAGFTILAGLSLMSAVQAGINPVERFGIYWIHTGIAFICTIAALWIRARLHDGFLYLVSITDDELVLGGVPASLEERIKAEFDPEELI